MATAQDTKPSATQLAMGDLRESLDRAHALADRLETRLAPVLRDEKLVDPETPKQDTMPVCPLVIEMLDMRARAETVCRQLGNVLGRLDL